MYGISLPSITIDTIESAAKNYIFSIQYMCYMHTLQSQHNINNHIALIIIIIIKVLNLKVDGSITEWLSQHIMDCNNNFA